MPRFRIAKMVTCALLILPALIGCATKNTYRLNLEPVVTQSQFAIIQNFGTADIDPSKVDALLGEVADMLGVTLDPSVRKLRIVVTAPENIAGLALAVNSTPSGNVSAMSPGRYVEALYLPKVSVALIPYFDRVTLGHELAHYVTDHYLRGTPLAQWEPIADRVEQKLWMTKPAPPSPAVPLASVALAEDAPAAASPLFFFALAEEASAAPSPLSSVVLAEDGSADPSPLPSVVLAEDASAAALPFPSVVLAEDASAPLLPVSPVVFAEETSARP